MTTESYETNEVRSQTVTFAYPVSFTESMREMIEKYGVSIEVVSLKPVDASGFPLVRVCGLTHRVIRCLAECWDDGGSTVDQMWDWANMMVGMEGAGFLWNHGEELAKEARIYGEHAMEYYYPGVNYDEPPSLEAAPRDPDHDPEYVASQTDDETVVIQPDSTSILEQFTDAPPE